ncbi:MAG: hypothetical protein HWD85_06180 [Flavobacteriaceae bacterium]|nr:hypothetical protein [Flavobacteriaceae bacterium]
MKKLLVSLSAMLFCAVGLSAQIVNPPTDIKSPNTSSLGKYGDIPISYYNGTTNVNVPLYSINEGGIPLNIYLNYDSSGIRVNSVASWVGQNWSLNAGGIITRTIRGANDTRNYDFTYNTGQTVTYKGFKHTGHRLNTSNWSSTSNLENLINESNTWHTTNPYRDMDLEPDIFVFNFMGISGKFFLGNDGKWKVQSKFKLKISTIERAIPDFKSVNPSSPSGNDIGEIIIEDYYGNKYYFGKTNDHIEYSAAFKPRMYIGALGQPYYQYDITDRTKPNAWYLSSVTNNKNEIVYTFNYERGNKLAQLYRDNSFLFGSCFSEGDPPSSPYNVVVNKTQEDIYNGTLIFPVYLKEIITSSGNQVSFSSSELNENPYSPTEYPLKHRYGNNSYVLSGWLAGSDAAFNSLFSFFTPYSNPSIITDINAIKQRRIEHLINQLKWRKLDNITIKNYNNKHIKSLDLNFTLTSNRRLNLTSIDEIGINNELINLYSFDYNQFDQLPNYLSKKIDKWGFYNGNDFILTELTDTDLSNGIYHNISFTQHGTSRIANENYAKIGMLNKIIYPTKGYTLFEYESNRATKKVNNNKVLEAYDPNNIIGGVRIKKIEKISNFSANIITSFEYSDGILMYEPDSEASVFTAGNSYGASYIFNINNIIPLSNINGSHIGYSKVIERYADNSSTEYKYSDYNLFPDIAYEGTLSTSQSIFNKGTDKSLLRGHLIEILKKDKNGILKEKKTKEYLNVNTAPHVNKYVKAFEYKKPSICSVNGKNFGNAYKLFYMDYDVIKNSTIVYLKNGKNLNTEVNYLYNNDFLVSEISSIKSNGKTEKTTIKYVNDFINPSISSIYKSMAEKNIINFPIEKIKEINNKVIFSEINTFKNITANNLPTYVPEKFKKLEIMNPVDNYNNGFVNNAGYLILDTRIKDKIIYDQYDSKGNIKEFHIPNGNYTTIIWGYKKTHPIAKIENITYSNIQSYVSNLESLSDNDNDRTYGSVGAEGNLRTALEAMRVNLLTSAPNAKVTYYTYDPLIGITSITDNRGKTIYYNYDSFGRLEYVRDHNNKVLKKNEYNYKN